MQRILAGGLLIIIRKTSLWLPRCIETARRFAHSSVNMPRCSMFNRLGLYSQRVNSARAASRLNFNSALANRVHVLVPIPYFFNEYDDAFCMAEVNSVLCAAHWYWMFKKIYHSIDLSSNANLTKKKHKKIVQYTSQRTNIVCPLKETKIALQNLQLIAEKVSFSFQIII